MANHIFFVVCCLSSLILVPELGCNTVGVATNGAASGGIQTPFSSSGTNVSTENPNSLMTTNGTTTEKPTTKPPPPPQPTTKPPPQPTTKPPPQPTTKPPPPPTTTDTPANVTTDHPSTTPFTPSNKDDRSFDLPSFIGGVILSLGLAAIGYVVYKFYRTRTDPNYRTL